MRKRAGETGAGKTEKCRIRTKPARQKLLPPAGSEMGPPERAGLIKEEKPPKNEEIVCRGRCRKAAKCRDGKKGCFGQFA